MVANYYDLLGVAKSATTTDIRKAYAKLARERHPDRFPDPAAKLSAQQTFQAITAAFNALSNDRTRAEYDKSLEAPPRPPVPEEIARDAFDRGQKLFEAKNFFDAVELLRIAVAHAPQEARYLAALGRALARNPHWVREGIQTLEKAVQLAPRNAGYHAELAELLAGQGLRIRARKAAEAALRLDPQHATALKVLGTVGGDEPPATEGGGGIRGLLRRKP
jgi:curved DNA-binding protein CbpA